MNNKIADARKLISNPITIDNCFGALSLIKQAIHDDHVSLDDVRKMLTQNNGDRLDDMSIDNRTHIAQIIVSFLSER